MREVKLDLHSEVSYCGGPLRRLCKQFVPHSPLAAFCVGPPTYTVRLHRRTYILTAQNHDKMEV